MDSLTQIVLGAAVGEAVLGKKVGNKAILWGAIGGTIPDLDVISRFFVDGIRANELHRGFTHSILFCFIAAPVLGWLVSKIHHATREVGWKQWSKLFFWALFTHPLLDAHTTWGTQLFWPLEYKVAYNNIFVADPLYTIPFLVCVIIAMFYKRTNPKRTYFNKLGLVISTCYMALTILFKGFAFHKISGSLKEQNIDYVELSTRPTPLNSILWTANVETENSFLFGWYSLFDGNKPVNFISFPKNHLLLGGMASEPLVNRLIKLSRDNYTITEKEGEIYFNDLRFGQVGMEDPEAPFVYCYQLKYNENGDLEAVEVPRSFEDGGTMMGKIFSRMLGR